jgi:hypothetical protein
MSRNRGKPKPKLRDLSINPLTHSEQTAVLDAVAATASPIATAILGAVLVEHELEASLRKRFKIPDDEDWKEMVDEGGFLSTFARKIMVGRALRLYDTDVRTNLDIVRAIRNGFAHSKRLIDFDHPLVSGELKKIKIPKKQRKAFRKICTLAPKDAYVSLCYRLFIVLLSNQSAALKRSTKRWKRKNAPTSPFYQALAPALGLGGSEALDSNPFRLASLGLPLKSFLGDQTFYPKSAVPLGLLSGLFPPTPKTEGNEDK